jgi:hypothetical protein
MNERLSWLDWSNQCWASCASIVAESKRHFLHATVLSTLAPVELLCKQLQHFSYHGPRTRRSSRDVDAVRPLMAASYPNRSLTLMLTWSLLRVDIPVSQLQRVFDGDDALATTGMDSVIRNLTNSVFPLPGNPLISTGSPEPLRLNATGCFPPTPEHTLSSVDRLIARQPGSFGWKGLVRFDKHFDATD